MATRKSTPVVDEGEDSGDNTPSVMKPEILAFTIIGISPLLQNNPASFIGKTDEQALGTKKVYKDNEEAEMRCYLDPEFRFCHPCEAFTKAMVKAVAGKKIGKMFATQAIKGSVFITEPFAIIEDDKGNAMVYDKSEKVRTLYTIDRRPVVIGKSRVLRCRPCWPQWRIRLALEVDTAILDRQTVKDSLSLAGRIIGIGDYRPEKGGGFGRFKVA